jgi:hypothetical protein
MSFSGVFFIYGLQLDGYHPAPVFARLDIRQPADLQKYFLM